MEFERVEWEWSLVMLVYFFSSYDASFFLSLLIAPFFVLLILGIPIFVFHWVFRNPNDREKDYKFIRASLPRLSSVCMATSLLLIAAAKIGWLFENQFYINHLLFISLVVAALALVLGILALPRWQGFIVSFFASANYFIVWFFIFLESQYQFHK